MRRRTHRKDHTLNRNGRRYIDDQLEIDVIWHICEEIIKSGRLQEEPWKVREEIIQKITDNEYYDEYGVSDPMMDLIRDLARNCSGSLARREGTSSTWKPIWAMTRCGTWK